MSTTVLTRPQAAGSTSAARRTRRVTWLGFAVVLLASVMDLLDSTITQTGAPAIRRSLGGSYADLEWLTAAYTLAMSVTILLGGRLGDMFGRRRVLLLGIGGFIVASTLCALAPDPTLLIAARALQGGMAAVMVPQGFGLIRELFGDAGQQKAFGIFGPVMGLGAVAGPLAGGGLIHLDLLSSGWRAIFLINIPLGLLALGLGLRFLPRHAAATPEHRFDVLSVALSVGAGVCLIYPLIQGQEDGWPLWTFLMLAGGLAMLALFALHQARRLRRGATPLVDPAILRRRPYVAGLGLVVGFIGAMGGMVLAFNVMFQTGLGFSPLACGVATVAIPLAAIPGSVTSSVLLERLGRTTIHLGTALMASGLGICLAVMEARGGSISAWDLTGPLCLTGFGMGMVFVPMFDVILAGVEPRQTGSAAGLLESVQQLSMSLGIALVGTILFGQVGARMGHGAFVHAAAAGLGVAIGLLVLAWGAAWWLPKHAREAH
jgi:EmrB/QacA subfamily drug resistance transporter